MREVKLAFPNFITESLPFLQLHSKYRITNRGEVMSISNVNVSIKLKHLALKQAVSSAFKCVHPHIYRENRRSCT